MKPITLHEKLLELYANKDDPEEESIKRCIENYIHKKYTDKKLDRIASNIKCRYDLRKESIHVKCRNKLSSYIDSIVSGRIRDSYKSSDPFDFDGLDDIKFKALVKLIMIHFGYEVLYLPNNGFTNNLTVIVHRNEAKVAVFAIKNAPDCKIESKTVKQARYIANHYNCEQAIIISNSFFDKEACSEAVEIGVTLLDRDKLTLLVHDLIENKQKQENELLLDNNENDRNLLFLDGQIKSPKAKVQVVFIKYFIDSDSAVLVFQGKLLNTGKKPVKNISADFKIFNRNGDCTFKKSFPIEKEILESNEEISFKFYFNEISRDDWQEICRYEIKLEYSNIYKV